MEEKIDRRKLSHENNNLRSDKTEKINSEHHRTVDESLTGNKLKVDMAGKESFVSSQPVPVNIEASKDQNKKTEASQVSYSSTSSLRKNAYRRKKVKSSAKRVNIMEAARKQQQKKQSQTSYRTSKIKKSKQSGYSNHTIRAQLVKNRRAVNKQTKEYNALARRLDCLKVTTRGNCLKLTASEKQLKVATGENRLKVEANGNQLKLSKNRWTTLDMLKGNTFRKMKLRGALVYLDRGLNEKTTVYEEIRASRNVRMSQVTAYKNGKSNTSLKLDMNLESRKTENIVVRTHRLILPDKKKVYSEKVFNCKFNPTFKQELTDRTVAIGKGVVFDGSKLMLDGTRRNYTNKLKEEGGFTGEMIHGIIEAPGKAKAMMDTAASIATTAVKTPKAALTLTWNMGKVAAEGTYMTGKLAVETGKSVVRGTKYLRKNGVKKSAEKALEKTAEQTKKLAKKAAKMAATAAKELIKKIALIILPVIGVAILIMIIISMILSIFQTQQARNNEMYVIADSNSILATQNYMDELIVEWDEYIEEVKEQFLIVKDCPHGYNDKVFIKYVCDEEPATVNGEYLAMYAALNGKYELQTENMGVENGTAYNSDYVDADTMKEDLKDWFEYMYPKDMSQWLIEKIVRQCPSCEEPDYTPHNYTYTYITINFRTITELFSYIGLDNQRYDALRTTYANLFTALDDSELEWTSSKENSMSSYDSLSEEEWLQALESAPVMNCTRKEFVEFVKNQNFDYLYGGKDPSTGKLDCSGFTTYCYREMGVYIGDGCTGQFFKTKAISQADARPGDLVFKQEPGSNGIPHVGIYLGEDASGKYCHCASTSGTIVNNYKGFVIFRRPYCRFADE